MVEKTLHKRLEELGYFVATIGDPLNEQFQKKLLPNLIQDRAIMVPGESVPEVFGVSEFGAGANSGWYVYYKKSR